jgi:peptidoglycan/xylan/chitin deacetylase (PgdA/CDA1 family)
MWTVIGRDWRWPGLRVAARLLSASSNGAIFCLHDGRTMQAKPDISATLEAVDQVIPRLLDRGFEFVTVGQLLHPRSA